MKKIYLILFTIMTGASALNVHGQCSGGASAGSITPTLVFQTVGLNAGQYKTFAATAGNSYIFTFCQGGGSAGFDSQLTILDNAGAYAGGYSDDVCGVASEVSWTAPATATYRVLLSEYFCSNTGTAATLAYRVFVPGPGANCANPHIIASLPFTANGLTTCGAGNDYAAPQSCNSAYMGGEDYVFRYVAPAAQNIRITLTNTASFTGVFVTQGCPDIGVCIAPSATGCGGGGSNTSALGNPSADFALPAAGTYYFFVDTWPSPNCTPFDINVQTIAGGGGPGCGAYTISTPAYAPDNFNSGTQLTFPDDEFSPVVNLPFTFCFMGTNYNQIVVSSNAYISFNTACAGQYSGWDTDVIAAPANVNSPEAQNSIMFPWVDVDPGVGGTIKYNTYGTSPNRRFVVAFRNVPMFSIACNPQLYTGQVVIYETSFVIDIFIQNLPNCPTWNNGEAVLGLFDASGTVAVPVPGYNNTVYTLSNFARRFTPNCPTCNLLPVAFGDLSGSYLNEFNELTWKTTHEVNTASFTLERSRDGQTFEKVGTLDAMGTDPMGHTYQMEDHNRFPGQTIYRVVEKDLNGSEIVSDIVLVSGNPEGVAITNIQADQDFLQMHLYNGGTDRTLHFSLMDALGKVLFNTPLFAEAGNSVHTLDISNLSSGVYVARVISGEGEIVSRKFVVE